MKVRKAVITAAGPGQQLLPLQRLVDQQGADKTALQLIAEEVASAGVEEICVIIGPDDHSAYHQAAGELSGRMRFISQPDPLGYGDALFRACSFVGNEPFLHLVGDHLYLSGTEQSCARQLIEAATAHECAVSAVQATRENRLPYFGTVGGTRVPQHSGLYEVQCVVEKPTPTQAERDLVVSGLRSGYYLCFFGMHVLTPVVMDVLEELLAAPGSSKVTLSDALQQLAGRQRYLACQLHGTRYNIGMKYGLLIAQLALALTGHDRDQILTELVELLAYRTRPALEE